MSYGDTSTKVIFVVLECKAGFYGEQCGSICGHCLDNGACEHITGYCLKGCEPGYQGINCTIGNGYYIYHWIKESKIQKRVLRSKYFLMLWHERNLFEKEIISFYLKIC